MDFAAVNRKRKSHLAHLRSRAFACIFSRMSLRSMTGYGREIFSAEGSDFTVEISSVNQRGLAISVAAPSEWSPAAERIVSPLVRAVASRGKVNVSIRAGTAGTRTATEIFSWDETGAGVVLEKMKTAATRAGVDFQPTAEIYLRLAEIHRTRQGMLPALGETDDDAVANALKVATERALENFVLMRETEGANLEKDLRERLARLRAWTEEIRANSAGTVARARDAFKSRLVALGVGVDLDDVRVLKEIAIFADRCDISEELTRLESHFSQFETCFAERECGRKLDFICQEILREFNTIGSKANNAAITRCVVEAKNEQERLREQVQNVE